MRGARQLGNGPGRPCPIAEAGGITAIAAARARHADDEQVQTSAGKALDKLAANAANAAAIEAATASTVVVAGTVADGSAARQLPQRSWNHDDDSALAALWSPAAARQAARDMALAMTGGVARRATSASATSGGAGVTPAGVAPAAATTAGAAATETPSSACIPSASASSATKSSKSSKGGKSGRR